MQLCMKIDDPAGHHLTAEDSFGLHWVERFRAMCPGASVCAVNVAENITVFIRGEGMDLSVPMTDAVAAILSRFGWRYTLGSARTHPSVPLVSAFLCIAR